MKLTRSEKANLKWKEPRKFKDDEYFYTIVQIQESGDCLCFKFTPFKGAKIFKKLFVTIENYKQYSALDIVNALEEIGFNTRHSYDAVMHFYHDNNLDLGFMRNILKPMKL